MEEQASQHKGGRDPSHLAPHPNLDGLPDTRVSKLPDSLAKPVDNLLAEALSGGELQRVGRVSLFVSLPTHRSCGVSVMWSWRSPAGRRTAPKIAQSSWISPAIWSLTYSQPTSLHTTTSSSIVIAIGRNSFSAGQHSRSIRSMVRIFSPHEHTLPAWAWLLHLFHSASPARKLLPTFGQNQHPASAENSSRI